MTTKHAQNAKRTAGRTILLGLVCGCCFLVFARGSSPLPEGRAAGNPVSSLIKALEVGRPVAFRGLTIVPVYRFDRAKSRDFAFLDEAVKNGWIEITEIEGGRVPQVKISNLSTRTIFLLGGEILTGAKQDRILASDVLLRPGTRNLVAPVYCVEHGRWTAASPAFSSKGNLGTFELRAKAQEKSGGAQSEIWDSVAAQNAKVGVVSPTGAYQDAYEHEGNKAQIEEIEKKMAAVPRLMTDTIGVVIGLSGRVIAADLFADPEMFRAQWPKILRSSALSALAERSETGLSRETAAGFLKALAGRSFQVKKALDLGQEHSCLDGAINVQALVLGQDVIHLAAFPQAKAAAEKEPESRLRVIRDEIGL
ncbi:MAG: hypothetical protein JW843_12385 [Candidatus Aminicenantes bacterium]|nr:hypothetical protein [Candidatus Aminicenantes bacterium]